MKEEIRYINYGNGNYDENKWVNPKNRSEIYTYWNIKPAIGGLWASPVTSEYGWKGWCEEEEMFLESLNGGFEFSLKPGARIYTIDSLVDLKEFKHGHLSEMYSIYSDPVFYIDFEEAAKDYDAIFLTDSGQISTRLTHPHNLYGWDCESILVLNKDSIINVKNF